MRKIDSVILHCTATRAAQDIDAATVRAWHTEPPPAGRGWADIGYHYLVRLDGTIERGRDLATVGAHTRGHNATSVGVAYVGGLDEDGNACNTMTEKQRRAIIQLVRALRVVCGPLELYGHNDFSRKACPSFNVKSEFAGLVAWLSVVDASGRI